MFAEIQFTNFSVEAVLADYVIRGEMHSRGEVHNFLNDRNYPNFSLYGCELHPLAATRKIDTVRQELITVDKAKVVVLSAIDQDILDKTHLTISTRKVVFYCGRFAVHGMLHVTADAPDEDIIDETRDFFGITQGSIYPLMPVGTDPLANAPLMLINRHNIEAYSVQK
jgi:hypothetical protein